MKPDTLKQLAVALSLAALMMGTQALAANVDKDDQEFLRKAVANGQLEIEASKLAQQQGTHPDVKAYAQQMLQAHTAMDQSLRQLASSKSVPVSVQLEKDVVDKLDDLRKEKQGEDFDEEYAEKIAVDAHEDAIDLFEDAASGAEDADIKAFAAKALPDLRAHLAQGKTLKKTVDDHDYKKTPQAAAERR